MRNTITQRRNEQRDKLAAATARNVPAYSRGATYRESSHWYHNFLSSIAVLSSARRVLAFLQT
jgi:hypothetical protein